MSDTIGFSTVAGGGLDRIYDGIQSVLPGVTLAAVKLAVWDAIEDFCVSSNYWRQTVAWIIPAGDTVIDLNPIDGYTVAHWILNVTGLCSYKTAPPALIILPVVSTLNVGGTALVSCKPNRLSDAVPPFLLDNWSEYLRDGAMGRLYSQPAKPYSSPQLATYHATRFRSGIRRARAASVLYNDYAQWRFPYFSRGRQFGQGFAAGDSLNGEPIPGLTPIPDVNVPLIDDAVIDDGGTF